MYTAKEIKDKVYVPSTEEVTLKDLEMKIMLADYRGCSVVNVRKNVFPVDTEKYIPYLEKLGYNCKMLDFLGEKYLQVSW